MAFYHVGGCSCPTGCCDCGPTTKHTHVLAHKYENQWRAWGFESFHRACNYLFAEPKSWWNQEEARVFKLGTKPSMGADKNRLQTGGLYRYSRNPQMLGYGLMITSFLVAYFSYLVLIWFLLFIIAAFFMIKSEEEFLYQKYKEEYRDYCKQVSRIIKI